MAINNNRKQQPKIFDLTVRKPKVLLLGNGLSRAYNAASWDHFLDSINQRKEEFPNPKDIDMPMPLKIILLTNNHVRTAMQDNKEYFLNGFYDQLDKDICGQIRKLFDCGFDYVLTTNYSYELEYSVYGDKFAENRLKAIQRFVGADRAENKYLLHTFNQIVYDDKYVDVWHIHGEARKPDSMIIGSDYYSRLTSKVIDIASKIDYDRKGNINNVAIKSWVEALIYGDVYALGFGYDYSEQDLWWLLSRKAAETKLEKGRTFYYEPDGSEYVITKKKLLNVFGVETDGLDLGFSGNIDYRQFYSAAIEDIAGRVK
jgi:hypothetical protein